MARSSFMMVLIVACLVASDRARADETPAHAPFVQIRMEASPEPSPLRLAAVSTDPGAPSPRRSDVVERLENLQYEETLTVLGTVGVAAAVGGVLGGVSYAAVAGGAVVVVYLLLP